MHNGSYVIIVSELLSDVHNG